MKLLRWATPALVVALVFSAAVAEGQIRQCLGISDDPIYQKFTGGDFSAHDTGVFKVATWPDAVVQAETFQFNPPSPGRVHRDLRLASGGDTLVLKRDDPFVPSTTRLWINGTERAFTLGAMYATDALQVEVKNFTFGLGVEVLMPDGANLALAEFISRSTTHPMDLRLVTVDGAGASLGLCGTNGGDPAGEAWLVGQVTDLSPLAVPDSERIPVDCDPANTTLPNDHCNCDNGGHIAGQCNDGNLITGDGCSDRCTVEDGFECSGSPSVCTCAEADHYFDGSECVFCEASTTCSGNGVCGSDGSCECNAGFDGAACDQCAAGLYGPTCSDACTPIAECTDTVTCTNGVNSQCSACSAGFYLQNGGADQCLACSTTCPAGTGQTSACGAENDVVCNGCDPDEYNDGTSLFCSACGDCSPDGYVVTECSPIADAGCALCDAACDGCEGEGADACTSCATDHDDYAGLCVTVAGQNKGQARCINGLNKNATKLAKTQRKEILGCVRAAARGTEDDAQGCLTRDAKGKIAKTANKIAAAEAKLCGDAPDFGAVDATTLADAATAVELAIAADVFGDDLDAVAAAGANPPEALACQAAVLAAYGRITAAKLNEFVLCKKTGLKSTAIDSAAALGGCTQAIVTDAKGKIGKAIAKLAATVAAKCEGVDVAAAFPGLCGAAPEFAVCVDQRVECRVCQLWNTIDGLREDCDVFDDGAANGSCEEAGGVKRVFVSTASSLAGNLGGITGADALCQSYADGASLGGTWIAWLSNSTTDAASRLNPSASFERIDGVPVAADVADLTDGALAAPIDVNEFGIQAARFVWTGTLSDGTAAAEHCNDWLSEGATGLAGFSTFDDANWTAGSPGTSCPTFGSLYCFEQ